MISDLNWKRGNVRRDTKCARCSRTLLAGQTSIQIERARVCDACWNEVRKNPNRPAAELLRDFGIGRSGAANNAPAKTSTSGGGTGSRRKAAVAISYDGMQIVGDELDRKIAQTGTRVFHARGLAGTETTFDHVVIGRAGVTVIDTSNYGGQAEIEQLVAWASDTSPPNLWINKNNRRDCVDAAVRQRDLIAQLLVTAGFKFDVPVGAAICFVDVRGRDRSSVRDIRGVRIDESDKIAEFVQRRGPLTEEEIDAVAEFLDDALS